MAEKLGIPSPKGLVDLYQRAIAEPTNRGVRFLANSANSDTKLEPAHHWPGAVRADTLKGELVWSQLIL